MSILANFTKVNLTNSPSVTISTYGLTFNKTVVDTMGSPDYVILLLDEENKRLAIQCSDNNQDIPFCVNKSNKINARINNKDFARKLFRIMEWSIYGTSLRSVGVWYPDEKVFIFDLKNAERVIFLEKDESTN